MAYFGEMCPIQFSRGLESIPEDFSNQANDPVQRPNDVMLLRAWDSRNTWATPTVLGLTKTIFSDVWRTLYCWEMNSMHLNYFFFYIPASKKPLERKLRRFSPDLLTSKSRKVPFPHTFYWPEWSLDYVMEACWISEWWSPVSSLLLGCSHR